MVHEGAEVFYFHNIYCAKIYIYIYIYEACLVSNLKKSNSNVSCRIMSFSCNSPNVIASLAVVYGFVCTFVLAIP